jgi:transcriptional regulator with XRE-family HTH domain
MREYRLVIVQQMRVARGWSQQQLADISGLNVRTIQRIERGQSASLESFKALGAAFDVDFAQLQEDSVRETVSSPEQTEVALAFSQVRAIQCFWNGVFKYIVVMSFLVAVNILTSPHVWWVIWPALGWGLGLAIKATRVFGVLPWFGPEWERREVEKRLGRKL